MSGWKRVATLSAAFLVVAIVPPTSTISGPLSGPSDASTVARQITDTMESWTIAARGYSVTASTNCPCNAFVQLYANRLSTSGCEFVWSVNLRAGEGL